MDWQYISVCYFFIGKKTTEMTDMFDIYFDFKRTLTIVENRLISSKIFQCPLISYFMEYLIQVVKSYTQEWQMENTIKVYYKNRFNFVFSFLSIFSLTPHSIPYKSWQLVLEHLAFIKVHVLLNFRPDLLCIESSICLYNTGF